MAIYEGDITTNKTNKFVLDKYALVDNTDYTKLAYVTKVIEGRTEHGDRFYRFYLKDVNALTVVARLFNPDKNITSEYLNNMRDKIVKVSFTADSYANDMALKINSIETTPKDLASTGITTEVFLGVVDHVEDLADTIQSYLQSSTKSNTYAKAIQKNKLLERCKYSRVENVCNGKIGSAIYLIKKVCDNIRALADNEQQATDLCIQYVLAETCMFMQYDKNTQDTLNSNKIAVLTYISKMLETVKAYAGESQFITNFEISTNHLASCMLGISEPQTLGALIVTNARASVLAVSEVQSELQGLTTGSEKRIREITYRVI